jgi:hypothetical protein
MSLLYIFNALEYRLGLLPASPVYSYRCRLLSGIFLSRFFLDASGGGFVYSQMDSDSILIMKYTIDKSYLLSFLRISSVTD